MVLLTWYAIAKDEAMPVADPDVPVVRLDTKRIRALGWQNALSSREALRQSMLAMIPDMQSGKM